MTHPLPFAPAPVEGEQVVPGSKSETNRALVLAALERFLLFTLLQALLPLTAALLGLLGLLLLPLLFVGFSIKLALRGLFLLGLSLQLRSLRTLRPLPLACLQALLALTLTALLDVGDEVLLPAPDYPLCTAAPLPEHHRPQQQRAAQAGRRSLRARGCLHPGARCERCGRRLPGR